MKVNKLMRFETQKTFFADTFIWNDEDGEISTTDLKKWRLAFFTNNEAIIESIDNLKWDLNLMLEDNDFPDLQEQYKETITFLEGLLK